MLDIYKTQLEINERLSTLKAFLPFYKVYISDRNEEAFDMPSLILAILSFILYEGKLKEKGVSYNQIKEIVKVYLRDIYQYSIDEDKLDELTQEVILKLDEPYEYSTFNHQTKQNSIQRVSLIKADVGTLLYHITVEGLDFFLKTLEYQKASKIEMTMLLIQLQLENGTYEETLELIQRLELEVRLLFDEKNKILSDIANDSMDGFILYQTYREKIGSQLLKEKQVFEETMNVIQSSSESFLNSESTVDKEAYRLLSIIDKKLEAVKNMHLRLVGNIFETSSEYDKILDLRLKSSFSEKFNFESILDKKLFECENPDILPLIISPLLDLNIRKQFSIEKIFEPQRLKKLYDDVVEEYNELVKVDFITPDMLAKRRIKDNYIVFMEILLSELKKTDSVKLSEVMNAIQSRYGDGIINNIDFIPFLTQLNSCGENKSEHIKEIKIDKLIGRDKSTLNDIEFCILAILQKGKPIGYQFLTIETVPEEDVFFEEIIKVTEIKFSLQ